MIIDSSKKIVCWNCHHMQNVADPSGTRVIRSLPPDSLIGLVGVCSNCLEPGVCHFVCEHEHVHTIPFCPDLKTVDGLRACQFVLDSAKDMLPNSSVEESHRETIRAKITSMQSEINRLMQPYQS